MKIAKEIQKDIKEISQSVRDKDKVIMDIPLFERLVDRLNFFSGKCGECSRLLEESGPHFKEINENNGAMGRDMKKLHKNLREVMVKHMRKEHRLYRTGHFMSVYVPLGIAIGVAAGFLYGELISLTVAGLAAGYVIGMINENFAKKKGRRI
ncbi:MAG: hypothetical protein ACQEP4_07185 [Bacillota bacterium]